MLVGGLQKLTLVDFPGKVAAIVFTKGCLFRCPYCHNPDLVLPGRGVELPMVDVKDFLELRKGFLDGICISGGEPTLHKDLPEFIAYIKELGYAVKLDTNGVTPQMVRKLIDKKLVDYFAMDLKTTWQKYQAIANLAPGKEMFIENCKETFKIIQESSVPHEWRTTVLPGIHTEEDFIEIASWLLPGEQYFIQDINYAVTLDPSLDKTKRIDVAKLAVTLQGLYPQLHIATR
ncbi:MAG: anaerobic ribonucleoside-triphosphate reductase activating protein [Minisyncoccia bacterium]